MSIDDFYPPSLRLMIEQQQRLQKQFGLQSSARAVVEQQQRHMASISNASQSSLLSQAVAERKLLDQAIAGTTSSLLNQAVAERKLLDQAIAGVSSSLLNQAVAERRQMHEAIAGNVAVVARSWES